MKRTIICFAFSLLVGLTGCHRDHEMIGDAPRTETASTIPGGKEVSTSGVVLQFPEGWKVLDMKRETFEKGADSVFGSDPKFAALRSQTSAAAKQGMIKLMAFESSTLGTNFATNCNVLTQDTKGEATLEQIADATISQVGPLATKGTQPKVEYVTLKSGKAALIRSQITTANPSVPELVSLAYMSLKGSKLVIVTFTAPLKDEAHVRPIADQVMNTFRFGD